MPHEETELKPVDPLLLSLYEAAADHLNHDFEHRAPFHLFFGGHKHKLPAADLGKVESIVKAVCKVVGPVCEAVGQLPQV